MNIPWWVTMGFIAGWIATMVMKTNSSQGAITDIILDILGVLIGGFIVNALGAPGVTGFNPYSTLVSVLGTAILI